jgi:hypothetical protein
LAKNTSKSLGVNPTIAKLEFFASKVQEKAEWGDKRLEVFGA